MLTAACTAGATTVCKEGGGGAKHKLYVCVQPTLQSCLHISFKKLVEVILTAALP